MQPVLVIQKASSKKLISCDLFLQNQNSITTRRTYATELKLFAGFVRKEVQDVTISDVLDFKTHLESQGLMPATIVKKLRSIGALFKFLYGQGMIERDPMTGLKLPKVRNETAKDILSLAESNHLIASIETDTLRGKRDKAITALLLINGLRVCEIVRANITDLARREDCWVLRVHGKCAKDADTRIRDDVYRVIKAYLDTRGDAGASEPLFIGTTHRSGLRMTTRTVQYMIKDRLSAIGIQREGVTTHSLRHSAITHLIRAGASLLNTQEFARHSNPQTTMRYIHMEDTITKHAVMLNPIVVQG